MGVMECGRKGCGNILCSRTITRGGGCWGGYICDSCFSALDKLRLTWPEQMSPMEMSVKIEEFMDSDATADRLGLNRPRSRDELFESFTRVRE